MSIDYTNCGAPKEVTKCKYCGGHDKSQTCLVELFSYAGSAFANCTTLTEVPPDIFKHITINLNQTNKL